jgi:hypothetical protein
MSALGAAFLSGFNLREAGHDIENLLDFITLTPVYQGSWSTDSQAIDALFDKQGTHAIEPSIR